MKLIQIGVQSLRGPDGKFLPSTPVYKEVSDDEAKSLVSCQNKMLDEGATSIAYAMKRYKENFFTKGNK